MRKIALLAAALATLSVALASSADAQGLTVVGWNSGCYRFGETGYHWYDFCLGPNFVYPHQRVCDHGSCSYR